MNDDTPNEDKFNRAVDKAPTYQTNGSQYDPDSAQGSKYSAVVCTGFTATKKVEDMQDILEKKFANKQDVLTSYKNSIWKKERVDKYTLQESDTDMVSSVKVQDKTNPQLDCELVLIQN